MKITINKDGSLIVDGEGNTTIVKSEKDLQWCEIIDLNSIATKVELKGFSVKNIEDEGKDLMSNTPNYPIAE